MGLCRRCPHKLTFMLFLCNVNLAAIGEDFHPLEYDSPLGLDPVNTKQPSVSHRYPNPFGDGGGKQSKRPSKSNRADYIAAGTSAPWTMAKSSRQPLRDPSPRIGKGKNSRYRTDENQSTNGETIAEEGDELSPDEQKAKDKTLKKDELLLVVATLRQDNSMKRTKLKQLERLLNTANENIQTYKDKLQELRDDYVELDERNQELEGVAEETDEESKAKLRIVEKELAATKAKYEKLLGTTNAKIKKMEKKLEQAISNTGSKNDKVNEQFLKILCEKVKTIGWGKIKFIQNHEEQTIAAKIMWKHGELDKIFADNQKITKELKFDFIQTYGDSIKTYIFEKRSYATAEMKKWYCGQWKKNRTALSLQDLKMCLERKVSTDDEMVKFMIYWDEMLAKHIGSAKWKDGTKYYNTISGALRNDCEAQLPLITPYDEAFLVLSTENHLQRWHDEYSGAKPIDKKDTSGLYTTTKSGQNQYGGWSEAGLELFNQYVKLNEDARNRPDCIELEKKCLQQLRSREKIAADNPEEHSKAVLRQKNAKKRGNEDAVLPPAKKLVRTLQDVESSCDEMEDEDEESLSD